MCTVVVDKTRSARACLLNTVFHDQLAIQAALVRSPIHGHIALGERSYQRWTTRRPSSGTPFPRHLRTTSATLTVLVLEMLRERVGQDADLNPVNQYEVLSGQTEWPLAQLEKWRVDWILEEGHYTVFGDSWFVRTAMVGVPGLF